METILFLTFREDFALIIMGIVYNLQNFPRRFLVCGRAIHSLSVVQSFTLFPQNLAVDRHDL